MYIRPRLIKIELSDVKTELTSKEKLIKEGKKKGALLTH